MFKNTLINMLGIAIPGIIAIPALAYLARYLQVELFGVLLLAYAILGYAGIFDAGLTRAVIRKIATSQNLNESRVVMGTVLVAVLPLSLLPSAFIFFGAEAITGWLSVSLNLNNEVVPAIKILALIVPFFLVSAVSFAYLEGKQSFFVLNKYKIITGTVLALMPPIMVSIYGTLASAIIGLLIARVFSTCLALFSLNKAIGTLKLPFDKHILIELFSFGGWITLSNIISPLMVYADRFLLSSMVGANKVAFYNAPADLISKIGILPGAVAKTIFPLFSNNSNNIRHQERLAYIGLSVALLIVLTPIYIFSTWLLNIWLGTPYGSESGLVLKVLIIGFFFNALAQIPFSRIQALGKSKATALLHLCEVVPYLLLLVYLVERYALLGAAFAWTLRVFFDFILLRYLLYRSEVK